MNKTVLTSFTILCLLSTMLIAGLAFGIQTANTSETIYIRADGSIDPPTAPISSFDSVIYTLTGNITSDYNGIMVYRDSIVIDGAGYTLQGKGARGRGISFFDLGHGRNNITIKNMEIKGFAYGIDLFFSSYANIYGNNITNNNCGISIRESSDYNIISENTITNNTYAGVCIWSSSNNTVSENYVTNCRYGIELYWATNNNILGNNVSKNTVGIEICSFSSSNNIFGNKITANDPSGISLYVSGKNNIIYMNNLTNNYNGIYLSSSSTI